MNSLYAGTSLIPSFANNDGVLTPLQIIAGKLQKLWVKPGTASMFQRYASKVYKFFQGDEERVFVSLMIPEIEVKSSHVTPEMISNIVARNLVVSEIRMTAGPCSTCLNDNSPAVVQCSLAMAFMGILGAILYATDRTNNNCK